MNQVTGRKFSDEQIRTPTVLYRGGTSKAFIVQAKDLPSQNREQISQWRLAIYGSPDRRQIDGVGGADGLTSKFAIVGPPTRDDADLNYTFAQVGVDDSAVDWSLICGNITAAIGPFAIDEGLVPAREPVTTVRVHNTNTSKIIECVVKVKNRCAPVIGDEHIDGVPGAAAAVLLDFKDSVSTQGSGLLPTGNVRDTIYVPGVGRVEFSVVDAALPVMFVEAKRFGLSADIGPLELAADLKSLDTIDQVRRNVAVRLGWASSPDTAREKSWLAPTTVLVGPPLDWTEYGSGRRRDASDCDFTVRACSFKSAHKAFMASCDIHRRVAEGHYFE
jgi:2-methylaconitate cis-trans-isomerase PrpF